jgi:Cytochrome bd terminal oxidase subunit I
MRSNTGVELFGSAAVVCAMVPLAHQRILQNISAARIRMVDPQARTMTVDPVLLSRLQWSWVVAWHILLPAFTVGLASYIFVLEGLYLATRDEIWFRISGFWTKIFAVSFGMGVVSGTQAFLVIGTLFLLPIILGYTVWSYWVFRGKVKAGTGYH